MGEGHKPILCVGALTLDTIFQMAELPAGPGKFLPLMAVENAAGMASSAATAIARLGGRAALWASVGSDDNGRRLIDEIVAEGVDCTAVRIVEGARSAFATILVDGQGERIIVPRYDPTLLAPPATMPDVTAHCHAAVMTDVRWPHAAAKALQAARDAGIPGILDADVAPLDTLNLLLPLASHIVASEPAAARITGLANAADAVVDLAHRHGAFIAVTAGPDGVHWFDRDSGVAMHVAAPPVAVVDTLAAGDVFHGAFALGLVEGMPMWTIMRFAATAAALKCETFGGRLGVPRRAAVLARMAD
ncbi:PfkB family carbohydrate kinase [Devosia sp. SL43]|uniref:PfkB family carbohydrate kinase n=1 Tax=Devosia sp. SL43 TaxID=2806348 RepID=UPI001F1F0B93|nr:PfkB family carbohydrate kinase [Devosia sp. SL43]UJW86152.1 sugar kinase [Devosia sp. SL43]